MNQLRLIKCIRPRRQDIDFGQGGKDRVTFLPRILIDELHHFHFVLADSKTVGQTPKLGVSTMLGMYFTDIDCADLDAIPPLSPVVTTWCCIYGGRREAGDREQEAGKSKKRKDKNWMASETH